MRSTFLLILGLCGLCTGNLPQPEVVGDVCYEKDESPVDLDALFNGACTDVEGNTYRVGSELQSCCDCFKYKCQRKRLVELEKELVDISDADIWAGKVGWVRTVSERCCQTCNGTVFPHDTVVSTTQLEDDCLTIQTKICRLRPGLKKAVIELEFSYRNCCNDNNTLHPVGTSVAEPCTCSYRVCKYERSWPHSIWLTQKISEGCDCCLLPNGKMVPDGATWWDTSVQPPQMLECCRGKLLTPVATNHTEPPPPCGDYGILLTGGRYDDVSTELYIPRPCPGGIKHCLLPNVAKEQRYSHTQDGFMACGGASHTRDCVTLDPVTGIWQTSYAWKTPSRFGHVSWSSPDGVSLIGGYGAYVTTGLTTTLLQTMGLALPGFGLQDPSVSSCSIQFDNFVIVTGGLPYADSKQVIKYFTDGTFQVLPNLLIPRKAHSCGSYLYGGKEMLIVVAGETMASSTSVMSTNSVEIFDLSTPGTAWVSTTDFPFFISGSRAVTLDNVFYVTGGEFGIYNWNPASASWTSVTQLCSRGRNFHGASIVPVTDELLEHCKICNEDDRHEDHPHPHE